jgi:hypothetical protein
MDITRRRLFAGMAAVAGALATRAFGSLAPAFAAGHAHR